VGLPSTYFEDAWAPALGLEYDLATMFAKELGAKYFILVDNPATIDQILRKGKRTRGGGARAAPIPAGRVGTVVPSARSTRSSAARRLRRRSWTSHRQRIGAIEETVGDYLLTDPAR
jgi:membrane-bound lytic murein transglycosylase MltF